MKHLEMESWSRRQSVLHRADPCLKWMVALLLTVWIGTSQAPHPVVLAVYGGLLLALAFASGLPIHALAARLVVVLPFTGALAALVWLSGDAVRAQSMLLRSGLSAFTILLLAATTPMPKLFGALRSLGAPPMLVEVIQFLYRYLFVLGGKALTIHRAASSRGGFRWDSAAGAAALLFGSAYGHAEAVHRAMLARGGGRSGNREQAQLSMASIAGAAAVGLAFAAMRIRWGI